MVEIVDSNVIRDAIAAAQAKATKVSLRESDGDDATVHGLQDAVVDIPAFEGFTEFDLDLSCLSPAPSPPASIYTDARSESPSASPRQSVSFHSSTTSQSQGASSKKSPSPSPRVPYIASSSVVRGSWPLVRYVGRGTPIDRNRRIEWGAIGSEDVAEDGVLFSTVRSTSLDSALRPSQRSVSPEWNILHRRPSTLPTRSRSRSFAPEPETPTPEIQIEGLGAENPGEWASFMQTVLSGSSEATPDSTSASTSQLPVPVVQEAVVIAPQADVPIEPTMSPEEIRQLDTGLEMDLGIDAALDLGLGYRGGMNWFDLGMLPPSGRESPSVYSSHPPSPCPSRPPSVTVTPLDNRSTTSTKAEPNPNVTAEESKSGPQVWWKKMLKRLRKVHLLLGSH
ncbi:hypothetical protein FPV67DRAFT_875141 [Lyophyllum atratum]|nr:hypothetical protein FPV67DRAFT_875141 [Lyophyllum atratum]